MNITSIISVAGLALSISSGLAQAQTVKPNIIMMMADDVGYSNVGAYTHGMMVPTPNLDSLARDGILFTDHYAEPTCTPGRAAFITGQLPIRTGLTTVGLPGSPIGLTAADPTLAEVLKGQGYVTGQFGKNHLGDRNEHLPTVHGFDVFYGNLYHLNSEEEPEDPDWPKDPAFNARYGPRGVLDCVATRGINTRRRRALRPVGQAEMHRYRRPHRRAHGDGGRGVHQPHDFFHAGRGKGRKAVLRLVCALPHAHLHPPQA